MEAFAGYPGISLDLEIFFFKKIFPKNFNFWDIPGYPKWDLGYAGISRDLKILIFGISRDIPNPIWDIPANAANLDEI